jgi:DNA-binding transcriptional regulator YhcF (GntR family)
MSIIKFQIEKSSPVPIIKGIQEQIKLSIAMGVLKRGEVLPSIREVEKIRASTILVLLPYHAISSARFIVEQLHKWVKCKDANISWMQVDKVADFRRLLKHSQYEYILVSPGAQGKMPVALLNNSRILKLQMDLDPEAPEIARIRADVIV